ncbi:hypothetical protein GCM10010339_59310 [Streptomyces alanosinicus]|uniref:Uncharacterized protein n=1 Tax=Streptomyces alanosinicus TaxID=68171 RepID=A0A918YM70_9ACTN|nr:hypothetical protein GCM10010339_59310 [Streptomyces alanosinicus]
MAEHHRRQRGLCFPGSRIRSHHGAGTGHVEQRIGLASAGRIDLAPSITDRIPLADAADAVARPEKRIGDPMRFVRTP